MCTNTETLFSIVKYYEQNNLLTFEYFARHHPKDGRSFMTI